MDAKDDPKVLSMKEVVARETALLLDQQKRLSVRDLASKFEKGLAAAAKLSEEGCNLYRSANNSFSQLMGPANLVRDASCWKCEHEWQQDIACNCYRVVIMGFFGV
ncbi:hypothetical protein ACFE04_009767 [Oxalis oulophora]